MKKLWKVCLSLLLMFDLYNIQVKATSVTESESNNTIKEANEIELGDSVQASITTTFISEDDWVDDIDVYKIVLPSQGKLSLSVTSYDEDHYLDIMDEDGKEVWCTYYEINEALGYVKENDDIYLEDGIYYLVFQGRDGEYNFNTKFVSSHTTDDDRDDVYTKLINMQLNKNIVAQISENYQYDLFRINLPLNGYLKLDLKTYFNISGIEIYNSELAKECDVDQYISVVSNSGYEKESYIKKLSKGTYYIKVFSQLDFGKYELKASQLFTNSKPKVKVSSHSASSIKVEWNKISGANGYMIYRATSKSGKYSKIGSVDAKKISYINTGLKAGKSYYYRIKAYKNVDSSKYYSEMNTGIGCKPVPKKTTGLRTTSRSSSSISLTWNTQSGISGYEIYRGTSEYGKFSRVASVTSNKFTNNKRASGTYYYYKVRAYKIVDGKKVYGSFSKIHNTLTRPKKTTITSKESLFIGDWNIDWKSIKCDGYQIQVSRNKNFSSAKIFDAYEYKPLTSKKRYYFRVRGYMDLGSSKLTGAWSSAVSMIIQ